MGRLMVEYERPDDNISTVVEAALLPKVKATLDELANGLKESWAPYAFTGEGDGTIAAPDTERGFQAVRQQLLCELILWLENEFHDPQVEIIITGYDPDGYLEKDTDDE